MAGRTARSGGQARRAARALGADCELRRQQEAKSEPTGQLESVLIRRPRAGFPAV